MIISLSNFKGGVLKTTSTINIGAALAQRGKKVLLVDLDPQYNLSQSLAIPDDVPNVYQALNEKHTLVPHAVNDNLFVIPSDFELVKAEIELSSVFKREFLLQSLLEPFSKDFDYILIDCPPSLGLLTVNALVAADYTFIPIAAEYLALRGYAVLAAAMDEMQMDVDKVFLTKYDRRKVINRSVRDNLEAALGDKMFKTAIRDNIALAEAPTAGQSIFDYAPSSNGAKDYAALAEEIMQLK
ncbi:MAG: ParA family protein [Saprospiraceae bacterium]